MIMFHVNLPGCSCVVEILVVKQVPWKMCAPLRGKIQDDYVGGRRMMEELDGIFGERLGEWITVPIL